MVEGSWQLQIRPMGAVVCKFQEAFPCLLSRVPVPGSSREGGRLEVMVFHCRRRALRVEGLLVVVLKRDQLKEGDIVATGAGSLARGHGLPGDGPRWVGQCLGFGALGALGFEE